MLRDLGPAFRLLGLGWLVVTAVLGGFLLGIWVDGLVQIGFPAFALIGIALGVITAFFGVKRLVAQATGTGASEREEDS